MAGKTDAFAIVSKTSRMEAADICPCPMMAAETSSATSEGKMTSDTPSKTGLSAINRWKTFGREAEAMDDVVVSMTAIS
jgi:hypothetical protein